MIEIRLCNLAAALWFESEGHALKGVSPPADIVARFGLRACIQNSHLTESGLRELIVASAGTSFESADLVASVAHALALAALSREKPRQPEAFSIEAFVDGDGVYGDVPQILRRAGVYSCMSAAEAHEIATWMDRVNPQRFIAEVEEMYGKDKVVTYRAVARSLERIFRSVDVHNGDLCCIRK